MPVPVEAARLLLCVHSLLSRSNAMSIPSKLAIFLGLNSGKKNHKKRFHGEPFCRYSRHVGIEQLEGRCMLAVTYLKVGTVHTFTGDGTDDMLTLTSTNTDFSQITYDLGDGIAHPLSIAAGESVVYDGDGGTDTLILNGSPGND